MAIDTRSKRASSVSAFLPWRQTSPKPDATLTQGDRQHISLSYSGILASAPVVVVVTSTRYGGSRVSIYNKDGYYMGDIRTATVRSWTLAATGVIGQCNFELSKLDAKATDEWLEFGMYVLVRHPTLPDWLGIIYTPRPFNKHTVSVRAYQVEKLLEWRRTPAERTLLDTGGDIFKEILRITSAAQFNEKPVLLGDIQDNNSIVEEKLGDHALSHVQSVAESSGFDWDITHSFDANGRLVLHGNWMARKGIETGRALQEGANLEETDRPLQEDGNIVNDLLAYGDASTQKTRISSRRWDDISIARYGLFQGVKVYSGTKEQASLDANVMQELRRTLNPNRAMDLVALDVGETFSFLRPGNTWNVELKTSGFRKGGYGLSEQVRIVGMEFDDHVDRVELVTEVIYE